jgi:hypothetical protein
MEIEAGGRIDQIGVEAWTEDDPEKQIVIRSVSSRAITESGCYRNSTGFEGARAQEWAQSACLPALPEALDRSKGINILD